VEYPCTPPPSPRFSGSPASMNREDNLVHINMALIDKDAPNFLSHYEGVSIVITSHGLTHDGMYFVDACMNGFKIRFQIMS
jgi:hypothetical protein